MTQPNELYRKPSRPEKAVMENSITINRADALLLKHHAKRSRIVEDCFTISRRFGYIADHLQVYMKPDANAPSLKTKSALDCLLRHLIVNRRNQNYWVWTGYMIATMIEKPGNLDFCRDREKLILSDNPVYREIDKVLGPIHNAVAHRRTVIPRVFSYYDLPN